MVRILVVEDEKAISGLIEMNLKKAGYQTDCVYDGAAAAAALVAAAAAPPRAAGEGGGEEDGSSACRSGAKYGGTPDRRARNVGRADPRSGKSRVRFREPTRIRSLRQELYGKIDSDEPNE